MVFSASFFIFFAVFLLKFAEILVKIWLYHCKGNTPQPHSSPRTPMTPPPMQGWVCRGRHVTPALSGTYKG